MQCSDSSLHEACGDAFRSAPPKSTPPWPCSAKPRPSPDLMRLGCSFWGTRIDALPGQHAAHEVWVPVVACRTTACPLVLQRLQDLQSSTASRSSKMDAAQQAADAMTHHAEETRKGRIPKKVHLGSVTVAHFCLVARMTVRSRFLTGIRQQRLASREQLKAVGHTLQLLSLDFKDLVPADISRLRPVDPRMEKESRTPESLPLSSTPAVGKPSGTRSTRHGQT